MGKTVQHLEKPIVFEKYAWRQLKEERCHYWNCQIKHIIIERNAKWTINGGENNRHGIERA